MSVVAVAVGDRCVAAAADGSALAVVGGTYRMGQASKLWATDSVVAGVVGVVRFENVDVLQLARASVAAHPTSARDVATAVMAALKPVAPGLAGAARAQVRMTLGENSRTCLDVAIAEAGLLITVSVDWGGHLSSTIAVVTAGEPLLAVVGSRPVQHDIDAHAQGLVSRDYLHGGLCAYADCVQTVVIGQVAQPPRWNNIPLVSGPVDWVEIEGTHRLSGQMFPTANADLRP